MVSTTVLYTGFKNIVFAVLFHSNLPYEDKVVGTLIRLNDTIDLGSKS